MSVRFIVGRTGTGKTARCLSDIREKLLENPSGKPIIYIVPDQMTFLSEYELVSGEDISGMIRAQVYSFTRLAWRILQETGGGSRFHLSTVEINMLIKKIVLDQKNKLKVFQLAADKNGFTTEIEELLTEFRRYCVSPEQLGDLRVNMLEETDYSVQALQDKLADLELIYRHFEDALFGKYVATEDYFQLLAEKVSQSNELQEAEIYIDGFHSFTPQEYLIIEELMKHCRRVTITLTMDKPVYGQQLDELDLFRMTSETSQIVEEIARNEGVEIEEVEVLTDQYRLTSPSLQFLETHFDARPVKSYENVPSVHICQADNRRAEIEGIARKITEFTRDHNYRYHEIAILMRNGPDYYDLIETIFTDEGIPYFIDEKQTMLNHPLIELIRSTLETLQNNWRYESVFRAVKTELLFPLSENTQAVREQMDELENFVLASGIQGKKWTSDQRWEYRRMRGLELTTRVQTDKEQAIEERLNEWKQSIAEPMSQLGKRLKKATTGSMQAEALFLYIEELGIKEKLEKWQKDAEEKGELLKSAEHDQAWTRIIELLDQFVEVLGEEKLSLKKFTEILDAGMESLTFSAVPPALDQVVVADIENSRLTHIKALFVIGLNEGVLPAKLSDAGLLADADRDIIYATGLQLAPTSKTRLLDETFVAYKAFTTPSNDLYVSYPLANEEGKALLPSFYIKRMKDMFPHVVEEFFVTDPTELTEGEQLAYVSSKDKALSYMTAQLERRKRNYPMYDFWWDVYNYYVTNNEWRSLASKTLSSLFYENKTEQLRGETTKNLYGEEILASVSRMEMFHRCPFAHYAQHGLKLKERKVFRLEAPQIGELFHGALKQIAETIMEQNRSWASLSQEECRHLAEAAVESIAPKLQNEILFSSNRHFYMKRKLERVIGQASFILSEHAKRSGFAPIGLEVDFGPGASLPALEFPLKNKSKMTLRGQIDRIDQATDSGDVFLRVVDYKSSEQDINFTEVYHGLSLQMLTYLDVVISHAKVLVQTEAIPAGVLYFHVHNPMITLNKMLSLEEIEEEIFKKFKMRGLLLGEERVVRLMDEELEQGVSPIIPAGFVKDGSFRKDAKIASEAQLESLRKYIRRLYVRSGNEMIVGATQIAPYKLGAKTACTFCQFKAVCQFDPSMAGNEFRVLQTESKENVLQLIAKEVARDDI